MKALLMLCAMVVVLGFSSMALGQAPGGPAGGPAAGPAAPAAPAPQPGGGGGHGGQPANVPQPQQRPQRPGSPPGGHGGGQGGGSSPPPSPPTPGCGGASVDMGGVTVTVTNPQPVQPLPLQPAPQPSRQGAVVKATVHNETELGGRTSRSSLLVEGPLEEVQGSLDMASLSHGDARRAEVGPPATTPRPWGWIAAGAAVAVAILFLILFLTTGEKKEIPSRSAEPPKEDVRHEPPPSPPQPAVAVDTSARKAATEANMTAGEAKATANKAMDVDQKLVATDDTVGKLMGAHTALTSDACASELESRWLMPGSPYQRMLEKGWLTPQQVKAKAREQCAR